MTNLVAENQSPEAGCREAAPAPGLGNIADFVPSSPVLVAPGSVKAWMYRSHGRELLRRSGITRRMGVCGQKISRGLDGVGVYARPDRAYGRVYGVCVCGQSICCPVCAPRIAAFRGAEVAEAFKRALDAGFEARLETFTASHQLDRRPDALLRQIKGFSDLWRAFGKHADRRERGAVGNHVGREVNWGDRNGWHYHHHRMRYDLPGTYSEHLAKAAWLSALEIRGLRSEAAEERAYHVGAVGSEAGARYVAKLSTSVEAQGRAIGLELTGTHNKGRNLNSLLADYVAGDIDAGVVWVNGVACVTATKVSSVRWSRGLRAKLGMDVTEQSDESIAQEEATPTDVFLGALNPTQWRRVVVLRAEFALLCAANRGADSVNEFLAGLSLGQLNDEDPYRVWANQKNEGHEGE